MQLDNRFRVSVPPEVAWRWLRDVERIAPCLPGAELREIAGDEYRGVVKVKVGPIVAQYQGSARFERLDEGERVMVLAAQAREVKGQGNAKGTATVTLTPVEGGTEVRVETALDLTGKVAQFGRGVIGDVAAKLIAQFVEALEAKLAAEAVASTPAPEPTAQPAGREPSSPPSPPAPPEPVRRVDTPAAQPIDLMALGGGSFFERHGVTIAVAIAAVVLSWVLW